jgi:peptidyl-prolyl cis-trans isomerase B (cyclophilin B)
MPKPTSLLSAAALTLALGGLLTACGGDDSPAKASDPQASVTGTPCSYNSDGSSPAKQVDPPPSTATMTGQVTGTITTNLGDLDVTLDAEKTPCTVNSFVSLAKQGYFDSTSCHRLTTQGIYVLQCGDPTGTGAGGPGYSFKDELSGQETYPSGTLAMANAGPDTNGSQFFIVYDDTPLPPSYTVFGSVGPGGVGLVKKVAKAGTDNANGMGDGAPKKAVEIQSVAIG